MLESHRGWDRGALPLARALARELGRPLIATTWSRLLVDANRSPSNRRIWSPFTARLSKVERGRILERYWRPHRAAVEDAVAAAARRGGIVHVAVHTFASELDGERRTADIGLLYDSARTRETGICMRWVAILERLEPELRLRRNYPYLGRTDGLTTALRRVHGEQCYLGIELEVNQALVDAPGWRHLQRQLAASLRELVEDAPARPRPFPRKH